MFFFKLEASKTCDEDKRSNIQDFDLTALLSFGMPGVFLMY